MRLELTTNGLTVPTRSSVWSRYVRSGAVLYGVPTVFVRPVRSGAVWYGYTYGYTTNAGYSASAEHHDQDLRGSKRVDIAFSVSGVWAAMAAADVMQPFIARRRFRVHQGVPGLNARRDL